MVNKDAICEIVIFTPSDSSRLSVSSRSGAKMTIVTTTLQLPRSIIYELVVEFECSVIQHVSYPFAIILDRELSEQEIQRVLTGYSFVSRIIAGLTDPNLPFKLPF